MFTRVLLLHLYNIYLVGQLTLLNDILQSCFWFLKILCLMYINYMLYIPQAFPTTQSDRSSSLSSKTTQKLNVSSKAPTPDSGSVKSSDCKCYQFGN